MQNVSFTAKDGYRLHGKWAVPVGDAIGTVVLNSATGVRMEYYLPFAGYLVQNGYRVLVYDYRGIGASAPKSLKGFKAAMHEWATQDMNAALHFVTAGKGAGEVLWIGHSIGAQLVGLLEQKDTIKKVLAVSCSTGYWNYFPFPYNLYTLALWKVVGPLLLKRYGYVPMDKIGWGEPLPTGVWLEWRRWCFSKNHFTDFLLQQTGAPVFQNFNAPITAVHATDDYIANAKTIRRLLDFYPASPTKVISLLPEHYGVARIGHTAIFRKKFQNTVWLLLVEELQ